MTSARDKNRAGVGGEGEQGTLDRAVFREILKRSPWGLKSNTVGWGELALYVVDIDSISNIPYDPLSTARNNS